MSGWKRVRGPLASLGRHELCFVLGLLALRALFRPYMGLVHDAALYSLQVMHHVRPGFYAEDLFFAYGSQDAYSVFPSLLAPLAAHVAIEWTFFLAFAAGTILLSFAEVRFMRRLIVNRAVANLALVLLAVSDVPYGGRGVFHAHEWFLTARLPAEALVLLGLDQLLRKRYGWTLVTMLTATAIHPLMAIGGLAVAGGFLLSRVLPVRWTVAGAAVGAASAIVILHPLVSELLFGKMDGAWLATARTVSGHCFLSRWSSADWLRVTCAIAIAVTAMPYLRRESRRLVLMIVIVSLASLALTGIGELNACVLLVQGQAYRALWLLQLCSIPLGLLSAVKLWEGGSAAARLGSIACLGYVGDPLASRWLAPESLASTLAVCGVIAMAWAVLARAKAPGRRPVDSLLAGALAGLVAAAILGSVVLLRGLIAAWAGGDPPAEVYSVATWLCSDGLLAGVGLLLLWGLWRVGRDWRRRALLAGGVWMAASLGFFACRESAAYRSRYQPGYSDAGFVRRFLAQRGAVAPRTPQVYWPAHPALIWLDVSANSYFSFDQVQGVVFSSGTAAEARRRAALVRPFEVARMRAENGSPRSWRRQLDFLEAGLDAPPPAPRDLLALARDEALDWIVVPARFGRLAEAGNDRVSIYDCSKLRALAARELAQSPGCLGADPNTACGRSQMGSGFRVQGSE